MKLPKKIISLIFSYKILRKCYRCREKILLFSKYILYEKNVFCSLSCTEYQHY